MAQEKTGITDQGDKSPWPPMLSTPYPIEEIMPVTRNSLRIPGIEDKFHVTLYDVLFFGRSVAQGADTAIWLASSSEVEGVNGRFFDRRQEVPCKFRKVRGSAAHSATQLNPTVGRPTSISRMAMI